LLEKYLQNKDIKPIGAGFEVPTRLGPEHIGNAMLTSNRVLYQFPLSLYCEKTRWNLDIKGLGYQCRDMIPGAHLPTAWWLARQRTLPILRDGTYVVGDSTEIALYLDKTYPARLLLPEDTLLRHQVRKLEQEFNQLGDHVRRCVWSLAIDSPDVDRVFFGFSGYGRLAKTLGRWNKGILRQMIRRRFNVYDIPVAGSWSVIRERLDRLEKQLADNPHQYLVGDHFTLADLTAAAMLAPLLGPAESPWHDDHVPNKGAALRDIWRDTPVGQWVAQMYRQHRHSLLRPPA
jgi:glutathione S-transferase